MEQYLSYTKKEDHLQNELIVITETFRLLLSKIFGNVDICSNLPQIFFKSLGVLTGTY